MILGNQRFCIAFLAVLLGMTASVLAQIPSAGGMAPNFIQRGTTAEITINGGGLSKVTSIGVAESRGVTIEVLPQPATPNDAQLKLKVTADADAAPGEREFRLISPTGVSMPLRLTVEQFAVVSEVEPNNKPEQPQEVKLPAVILGKIDGGGDADVYRFTAVKGQTLVFNVFASRLRSPLDSNLILWDSNGKEVASNNDHHGFDSFIAYTVPADGTYTLELRDLQYRGGGDYVYRLVAGAVPYVESIAPMAGQRGKAVDVLLNGYNLAGADKLHLDLTYAPAGRIMLRGSAALGVSNELPFEVTDLPPQVEKEPNNTPAQATAITLPADVTGVIEKKDDADFVKFHVDRKQLFNIEVISRRTGSPLDGLLSLHDATGNVIDRNNDAAGGDARIVRDLDPGDYLLSVRDLSYAGGPSYSYRLSVRPALVNPATGAAQDFAVRFLPDAARATRGGATKLWCDVSRINAFAGEVTVTLEELPPGVSAAPVVMAPGSSGIIVVAAAPDAAIGSFPIKLRATGLANGRLVSHEGVAELNGGPVEQAYITVAEAAPFSVQPIASLAPDRINALSGEATALAAKLGAANDQLAAQIAEWEKKVATTPAWTTLDVTTAVAAEGATLAKQPDGSILAAGAAPATDTYTVTGTSDLKGIVAIRLEMLTDPSLPAQGPGRPANGNFVLNEFRVTAAPKAEPAKAQPVVLQNARATFSQENYAVAGAIDNNPATGWAIHPQGGKNQTATFFTTAPVGVDGGTTFVITLEQKFGMTHTIGKFRLSVTTDPAAASNDVPPVPDAIVAIIKTPADKRTEVQKQQLIDHYKSIDPSAAADRARLDLLRNVVAPYAELSRLEAALVTPTPELDAAQNQWEQQLIAGAGWTPLEFGEMKSEKGLSLAKDPDGAIVASGPIVPQDVYTLTGPTPLKGITAIRIDVLPDARLLANGPGRNGDGNFILTDVKAKIAPTATPAQQTPVDFASAKATFEQQGTSAANIIDDKPDTGWGILPQSGRPNSVTLFTKLAAGGDGGNIITLILSQQAAAANNTLGKFRVSVTNNPSPDAIRMLPRNIQAIMKVPAANRQPPQKDELAAYYRSVAPSLDPVRQQLADLRLMAPAFPVATARGRTVQIPVVLNRNSFPGDVTLTLEGFQSGREGNGPANIAKSLKVSPLALNGGVTLGVLTFTVEGAAEIGTKSAVIRTEGKVGNDTVVVYSPAFPITVTEK